MNNKLTIGLFGMYGLYNYGCEAIVRGTYELIKKAWPDCKVILYTYCPFEDKKSISDLNIIVKQIPIYKGIFLRRVANKLLRVINAQKQLPMWNAKVVADECDVVLSVGGDIYTIPKVVLDKNGEKRYSEIVEFGNTVLKYRPYVIWGASIGPFGDKKAIKKYYFEHLSNVKQIFCREEKTLEYLKHNNVVYNVQLCSDPAFYINYAYKIDKYPKSDKMRIALNLSPLSIREQMGEKDSKFREQIIKTIKNLVNIPNTEIVLLPHVLSPLSRTDNDLLYLKDIYNSIPEECVHSVKILEDAEGFLGTKEFLRTCDIVIAARMHCAINAVCEGIPTIFLYYSQKGLGMANYIYGDSKWAIRLVDIDKELKNKTIEMLSNRVLISEKIKRRIDEIKSDEVRIVDLLRKLM